MEIYNLDELAPKVEMPGVQGRVAHAEHLTVSHWHFDAGADLPSHSHPHEQITYVAEGEIFFCLENEKHHLRAGDLFTVPGNVPHSVQLLSDKVRLVDTFTPIREDFL